MADIFQEVDEEVRRERYAQLWQRYGNLIIGLALLFVAAIAGWRGYEWWQTRKAAEAGAAFETALQLEQQNKNDDAIAAFDRIAKEAGAGGYGMLARFQEADRLALRDRDAAVKMYDALASDRTISPVMQDLARVRAGLLLLGTASFEDMRARLEPLAAPDRAFRHTARELLAFAAYRAGDAAALQRWSDMIIGDSDSPPGTRSRAEMLLALATPEAKS